MYTPLPAGLLIQKSSIEGQGLFTNKFIEENIKLGLSHIVVGDEIIRTPLGGFVNHSDNPNCVKQKQGDKYYLYTLRNVKAWEELTLKYTFYNLNDKQI
jgi:SET domain-containing protein